MTTLIEVTTRAAMEIVRLDRNKFNQAVADGFYVCAPTKMLGTQRVFALPDLIGLYVFARETEAGVSARVAGLFACRVVGLVSSWPDQDRLCFGRAINGLQWGLPMSNADLEATHINGAKIEEIRIVHTGNIRDQIIAKHDAITFPTDGLEN